MTKLSVNLNKVATLRNTRATGAPSVARAARIALGAGAQGITLHPRPDERHIRPHDVLEIAALLEGYPGVELNLEGNPFHNLVLLCLEHHPTQSTLVPDDEAQATSDHGWDLTKDRTRLAPLIAKLHGAGCRVSLFMDPVPGAMRAVRDLGAERVELYTESYASAFASRSHDAVLARFREAALAASAAGLAINAGHDLNLENLGPFLAAVPGVAEVSIGHALIADALELGLAETVRRYRAICERGA